MGKNELFKAYIAGFLDGEGSISILTARNPKPDNMLYRLEVNIGNCCKNILLLISQEYGGCVYYKRPQNAKPHWLHCYCWKIGGKAACRLLKDVYPYIRVKRIQAEIGIKFGKTLRKKLAYTRRQLSPYILRKRGFLAEQMRHLNSTKDYFDKVALS